MPMRKLVTFDFDDTLTLPIKDNEGYWVSGGSVPNEKTIATMKDIAARGHEVAIVTSRICTDSSKERIAMFVMEHELPVERDVVFTNKEWKADFLEEIGSVLHFDDSKDELERIEAKGIQAVEIPHPSGPRR